LHQEAKGFPMRHESTDLASLADAVADTAERVWAHIVTAIRLRNHPPGAVLFCERDLWRWHRTLRQAAGVPTPAAAGGASRQVAVVLLVELATPRDLDLLAQQVVNTQGPAGDGWRILHRSTHPDPAAIFGDDHDQRASR